MNGYLNCCCNHLTSFAGSLLVKPNAIDFDNAYAEIKKLAETQNIAVVVTVAVTFLVYSLLLIVARRQDRKDPPKKVSSKLSHCLYCMPALLHFSMIFGMNISFHYNS